MHANLASAALAFAGIAFTLLTGCEDITSSQAAADAPTNAVESYTVKRTSFNLVVVAKGELEAKERVEINNRVEGKTTITDLISEGAEVQGPRIFMTSRGRSVVPGTLLCSLAVDQINERIEEAELNVEQARNSHIAAQQALAIQKSEAESSERATRVNLALAELELRKWEKGADPQKRRELKLALEKAERNLVRAERDLEDSKVLYKEKFISLGELEDTEIAKIEAENALATAKLDIEVYEKYTYKKELQKVTTDVQQAEAELQRTLKKNEGDLARVTADLESKARQLRIREARLTKLKIQRRHTRVYAPRDGVVVYATSVGHHRWRRTAMARGVEVRHNHTLFYLPDPSQMVAALKVHEAQYNQVEEGQRVIVKLDSQPDKPIEGEVTFIASTPESGDWLNPDLREYMVKVDLPPGLDRNLKPAMRCAGTIMTGRVEDVLSVPVQAVQTEGKKHFVYVRNGSGWDRREIQLGQASDTEVEITEGLAEGEQVLLRKPRPGETAA